MTSSYRKTVEKFAENADPAKLPCIRCKVATPLGTLADYGARCLECYRAFCETADPPAQAPTLFAREAHEYTRRLMANRIASHAALPPGVKP